MQYIFTQTKILGFQWYNPLYNLIPICWKNFTSLQFYERGPLKIPLICKTRVAYTFFVLYCDFIRNQHKKSIREMTKVVWSTAVLKVVLSFPKQDWKLLDQYACRVCYRAIFGPIYGRTTPWDTNLSRLYSHFEGHHALHNFRRVIFKDSKS